MSMTTPHERQRVADLLRVPWPYGTTLVVCVLGDDLPKSLQERERLMRERLADLIDPTCHAEPVMYDLYGIEHTGLVRCSECHTVWREPDRVRYCPNCGARRVFDDGASCIRRDDE